MNTVESEDSLDSRPSRFRSLSCEAWLGRAKKTRVWGWEPLWPS